MPIRCPSSPLALAVALWRAAGRLRRGGRDAGAAALRRLGELRGLPCGGRGALDGLGPRARLDAAEARRRVLGDFDDASFESRGVPQPLQPPRRRLRGRDRGCRRASGESFDVVGVAGIRPLQQYLLSPEPGRTQAFDIAWDTERHRWYDLYPDQVLQPHDGLHWTGPYKSWEARCAECHATGFSRNYEPASRPLRAARRRRSASAARPATGRARRMPPGRRTRTATIRGAGRG